MKNNRILPMGLKGKQINERMMELMGINQINENKSAIAVELTKMGPDGKAYAIIRENHEYYIKSTNKTSGLIAEDFKYIGGLQNKKQEAYPSYAKAIKHLNIKFNSIQEALDTRIDINVFEDDNLLNEDIAGFSNAYGGGFSGAGNLEGNTALYEEEEVDGEEIPENPEDYTKQPGYIHEEDCELSDEEKAIDEMLDDSLGEGNFKKRLKTGIKKVGDYINKKVEPIIDLGSDKVDQLGIRSPYGKTKPFGENYMEEEEEVGDFNHNGVMDKQDFYIAGGKDDSEKETNESWMEEGSYEENYMGEEEMGGNPNDELFDRLDNMTGEELVQFLKDAGQDVKNKFMSMISAGADRARNYLDKRYPENESLYEGKLSINRAIDKMDSIIDSLTETDVKKKG